MTDKEFDYITEGIDTGNIDNAVARYIHAQAKRFRSERDEWKRNWNNCNEEAKRLYARAEAAERRADAWDASLLRATTEWKQRAEDAEAEVERLTTVLRKSRLPWLTDTFEEKVYPADQSGDATEQEPYPGFQRQWGHLGTNQTEQESPTPWHDDQTCEHSCDGCVNDVPMTQNCRDCFGMNGPRRCYWKPREENRHKGCGKTRSGDSPHNCIKCQFKSTPEKSYPCRECIGVCGSEWCYWQPKTEQEPTPTGEEPLIHAIPPSENHLTFDIWFGWLEGCKHPIETGAYNIIRNELLWLRARIATLEESLRRESTLSEEDI